MTKSYDLPIKAFVTLQGIEAVNGLIDRLKTSNIRQKDLASVQEVQDALYALTNDTDVIELKQEPSEIICNRCGDRTDEQASPDGDMCPDCHAQAEAERPSNGFHINQRWEQGSDDRVWTEGKWHFIASFHHGTDANHVVNLHNESLAPAQAEIVKMLVLSTSHITERVSKHFQLWVPYIIDRADVGHIMPIVTDMPEALAEVPACVAEVVKFAQARGCTWIMFDKDAPAVPGLPIYDW